MTDYANPLIVICAGAPRNGIRRSASALSDALSKHVNVLYVDPTASPIGTDETIALNPTLTQLDSQLWHLSAVVVPAHTRRIVARYVKHLVIRSIRRAIRRIGVGNPAAVFLQTPQMNLLRQFGERVSVYWSTDSFAAGSDLMGVSHEVLQDAESRAAGDADLVIAVTDELAQMWANRGKTVATVRNGVDIPPNPLDDGQTPDDVSLVPPIAGVVGTLSNRLDFVILDELSRSGMSILLIGPDTFYGDRSAFDAICSRPNVAWLGPKHHTELTKYYRSMSLGLVPYTLSDFNLASAPLKPLEYLSMGLPVVSTRLPGVVAIKSPDIEISASVDDFIAACHRAATVSTQNDLMQRRRFHAMNWSWDTRAVQVLDLLGIRSSTAGD